MKYISFLSKLIALLFIFNLSYAAPNGLCNKPGNYGQFAYKQLDFLTNTPIAQKGSKPSFINCIDDTLETQLAHEHFIKCENGKVVGGFGLSPEGPFDNAVLRQSEYYPKNDTPTLYNLDIMDRVISDLMENGKTSAQPRKDGGIDYIPEKKTKETTYKNLGWQCQNFAKELRKRYEKKYKDILAKYEKHYFTNKESTAPKGCWCAGAKPKDILSNTVVTNNNKGGREKDGITVKLSGSVDIQKEPGFSGYLDKTSFFSTRTLYCIDPECGRNKGVSNYKVTETFQRRK